MENLSSFRYPFLAGVVRCDEAECDGVEAEGRRQDFSEELKFTFKPSILLFKLSNLKIMHCTRYLSHALSASIRHKASVIRHRHHNEECLFAQRVGGLEWARRQRHGTQDIIILGNIHRKEEMEICGSGFVCWIHYYCYCLHYYWCAGNVRTQTFKEIHIYVKHHTIKKLINIYVNIFVG